MKGNTATNGWTRRERFPDKAVFHALLQKYVDAVLPAVEKLPKERRLPLDELARWVRMQLESGKPAKLTFICTHNSRRSHMAELWASVAAAYYSIDAVETYSGGTEATAFNPRAVAAMNRAGFKMLSPGGENPHYHVTFAENVPPRTNFSKTYDDPFNPDSNFAAAMTCTEADGACPFVKGAAIRVALPYEDPKVADGTPEEAAKYDERTLQIATEMFYLFSRARG